MAFESSSERVLENLVKTFEPRARAIIGFHRIPSHEGEDLVQQTYLTYLQRRSEIRDPQAWLAGTLRRRCLMFWRSRRQGWLRTMDVSFLDACSASDRIPQERVALRTDLSKVIARLPSRKRDLIRLRFGLGCDNREVASRLGYRYSGIYTITKRCMEALERELRDLGYVESEGRSERSKIGAAESRSFGRNR